jgi:hypothetical protein
MNGSTFFGLAFVVAGAVALFLWPALVVMAVIWIALGLVFVGLGFKFQGDSRRDAKLVRDGKPATATVTSIRDTGTTINKNPRVELTLQVQPEDGPPFEVKAKRTASRIALPQVGGAYAIRYDVQNPASFVWDETRPAVSVTRTAPIAVSAGGGDLSEQLEAKGLDHERAQQVEEALAGVLRGNVSAGGQDPLDRLEKLADLKAKGVLTEAEFAAEKAKILGA